MSDAAAVSAEPWSTGPTPRNRLADQVRRITALTVGRIIDDPSYEAAVTGLTEVADRLERAAETGKRPRTVPEAQGHPQDFFPTSPLVGYANPLAPPVQVWAVVAEDGSTELAGRAWFDYPYEGPPTCVHGGVIAALFDELLGSVNILTGQGGFTGTLTVRYRKTTPLRTDLDLVARETAREGRKIFAWGGIYHQGELTAEADGIFIQVAPRQMTTIVSANAQGADGLELDGDWARLVAEQEGGAAP